MTDAELATLDRDGLVALVKLLTAQVAALHVELEALKRSGKRQAAPFVHTDDTGWRQGGEAAWLMTFVTDAAAVYLIRPRHRNEEVREVIPGDWVMVADLGKCYDASELSGVKQQKCLAHVLRKVSEVIETADGGGWLPRRLRHLLKAAIGLWRERRKGPAASDHDARAESLKRDADHHLRDRSLKRAVDRSLLKGVGRYHAAGSLLRFLDDLRVEPTNNRAERALRSSVIARKVSHCTKNAAGSRAFEAWTSVINTLARGFRGPGPAAFDALVKLVHQAMPVTA